MSKESLVTCQEFRVPMKGTRPLEPFELKLISEYFATRSDPLALRDETLFFFSLYTGLRISETLSLKASDVWEFNGPANSAYISRRFMKGKSSGRVCPLNGKAHDLLTRYFQEYGLYTRMKLNPDLPLFFSKKTAVGLRERQGSRIFNNAFRACQLAGATRPRVLGTHCARKTFARAIYKKTKHNLIRTQAAMGHKSVASTASYLEGNDDRTTAAIMGLDFS